MGRLDGKVAIVTGAAQGQGEAEARLFAEEGAKVVVADVNEERGAVVAKEIGDDALFVRLDVSQPEAWDAAVEATSDRFGAVTTLVNNAAIVSFRGPQSIQDVTVDDFRGILDINLVGQFLGIQAVVPAMKQAGGGSIINVSSVGGFVATWGQAAYCVSKFGVRGLTKSAAMELGKDGIRVNSLHPGGVDTPMRANSGRSTEFLESLNERRALGRVGQPRELAQVALFLASDESSYCTAAEFIADGGQLGGDPRRFA